LTHDVPEEVRIDKVPVDTIERNLDDLAKAAFASIQQETESPLQPTLMELLVRVHLSRKHYDEVVEVAKWGITHASKDDGAQIAAETMDKLMSEDEHGRGLELGQFFLQEQEDVLVRRRVLLTMGRANYRLDKAEEAIAVLDEYLRAPEPGGQVEAEFLRGLCLMKLPDYPTAAQALKTAASLAGTRLKASQALFLAGQCYLLDGDYRDSRKAFEQVLSKHPNSPLAADAENMVHRLDSLIGLE
jgi:tetratricopeptide (TPR) repeat protein